MDSQRGKIITNMSIEVLVLSFLIDIIECRHVATVDTPGAFMQADMEGETRVGPAAGN